MQHKVVLVLLDFTRLSDVKARVKSGQQFLTFRQKLLPRFHAVFTKSIIKFVKFLYKSMIYVGNQWYVSEKNELTESFQWKRFPLMIYILYIYRKVLNGICLLSIKDDICISILIPKKMGNYKTIFGKLFTIVWYYSWLFQILYFMRITFSLYTMQIKRILLYSKIKIMLDEINFVSP